MLGQIQVRVRFEGEFGHPLRMGREKDVTVAPRNSGP